MSQQRIGKYRIIEKIAAGSQGTVYRAFDPDGPRIVALKLLHPTLTEDNTFLERFHREARVAASISHPNVIRIFEVGDERNDHFIAMEFLPESLSGVLQSGGALPLASATQYAVQIADGLSAAHDLGIVHRDIKPQNILIGTVGEAKITDFGIARIESLTVLTVTGVMIGTPQYMPPEQAQGRQADVRSDIYSVGCMLYEMLTGETPFRGTTPLDVIRQHIDGTPRPIIDMRPDIPRDVAAIVERAMAKEPGRRYQTIAAMSLALQAVVPERQEVETALITQVPRPSPLPKSEPAPPPPHPTAPEPTPVAPTIYVGSPGPSVWSKSRNFVIGGVVAVVIAVVVGAILLIFGGDGPDVRPPIAPPVLDISSATELLTNKFQVAGIDVEGEIDFFSFDVQRDTKYLIETVLGSLSAHFIFLYANGTTIVSQGENIFFTANSEGRYFIAVRAQDSSQTGRYSISVSDVTP